MKTVYGFVLIAALLVLSCHHNVAQTPTAQTADKQVVESEPVTLNVPVQDSDAGMDNIDLSVSKRLETNFNLCLQNKYFSMTLTNEIDQITLENKTIPINFCEQTTFSCDGTENLNLTNVRIVICPNK